MSSTDPILDIIESGLEHGIHKWFHYLPIYHKHFQQYKNRKDLVIVEIGVQHGGSIDLWNKYFGMENCTIYGIDNDPRCKGLEKGNVKIIIGDQGDITFLNSLLELIPKIDILIDDGGHFMLQQINTFNILFDHVKPGGIFLCEDVHTSYIPSFGGILRNPGTFIEFAKNLVDEINGYHSGLMTNVTKTCSGIYFYDSIVILDKSEREAVCPSAKFWNYN